VESTAGCGGRGKWRIEVAFAGAVAAKRRKKKSVSSFLWCGPHPSVTYRKGMWPGLAHLAKRAGLLGCGQVSFFFYFFLFNPFSFSFSSVFYLLI
jgi:hypothetical protein